MIELIQKLGGRKFFLALVSLLIMTFQKQLGLDQAAIDAIWKVALGIAGFIAAEDAAQSFANGKTPPTKP